MKQRQDDTDRRRQARLAAILAASALAAPFAATPALAQAGGEASIDSNTIIVTAQRRQEALEDVPMSVAVVTGDTLATAGVSNLRDLANITSGYQLGAGGAFPQPAIRGVTTIINGSYENNVAVYVDGLYQTVAQAINIDLPNVENIQILKGPQGTLYGRNATGGALLLTTIRPGDTWKGKAELTYAMYDDKRASGYVAGPLNDAIGISAAGYVRRSDGYYKFASRTVVGATEGHAAPIEQDSARLKLVARMADNFTGTLAYAYTRVSDTRTNVYSPIENVVATYGLMPAGAQRPMRLGVYAYDPEAVMEVKQHEVGLTLELDTAIGKLRSISGYAITNTENRFDFDGSWIPMAYSDNRLREKTFQQAVDLTIDTIEHVDLIVGGTYFHDHVYYPQFGLNYTGRSSIYTTAPATRDATLADFDILSQSDFNQKKNAWALYADMTFHATDRLSLNVGGRYSEEKQNVFSQAFSASAASARPANNQSARFRKFTPRASIRYEVSPRTNIYASYSQGFRSGAFNSQQPACAVTDPSCYTPAKQETIDAFEIGFKTAQHNFRAELAGFYYDYKNLQVSATKTVNGFPFVDVTNAPKAEIYGVEANFEVNPVENLTIRASATWLHARYGDGFLFSGTGVANAGTGGGVGINQNSDPLKTYLNVGQIQDLSGLQMSRAPDFTGNIGFDYLVPMGDGGLRFAANVKYTSSYVVTNPSVWGNGAGVPAGRQREQRFREGAFALLNMSVTWTDPGDHYYVRVWGNNLTDHKYRLHYTGTTTYGTYEPMAEPRVVGGTVGYKF
ncbi:MAG: TonB-dependent receptor [Novosphingobium sp.]|nr:TonB-dependent receptor [Novosphingobium sp.]